ncbi:MULTISPECIES: AI-2E family transporter [Oleiagrimonas]|jgi:predicted PurR-regulated permease PerM|uniref:AI-2E family transporter n=1 Tax=Oleiagrimonas citrea TaxID=1665687 RepID=A0A846ZQK4_9GAMM|nr:MULTISPECIES: AI-2E family transporter [Oleiagrimonas]NKZ39691.1 AI-2E family transporter [Oleiagrimonas citrea]RAP59353.1 AI-2E family transporter [Oleiagrimonas sp. MCCC 1A03011]
MTPDVARRWQGLAIILVLFAVLWLLAPVLMPFAVAAGFAYLGDPIADRLERWKLSRTVAVSLVFACMILVVAGALLLLVPLLQHQIRNLIDNIPRYVEWVRGVAMPWLQVHLHLGASSFDSQKLVDTLKEHIGSVSGVAAAVLGQVSRSGFGLIAGLANLILIPVVTFYLLRDWDVLIERIERMLPRRQAPVIRRLARESDQVLGAFVRGQMLVMLALGVIYGTGLTLMGLSVGPLIGMIAGLLSFVPYLGFIIGLGASLIAALVQYGDWMHIALVLVVFGIGQVLEGYVLVPRLVGNKIGLHPVAVIFAVLAGGHLFGFLGVLLALPAAAIIMVLLRYGYERYQVSDLYGHGHEPPPALDEGGVSQASSVPDAPDSDD